MGQTSEELDIDKEAAAMLEAAAKRTQTEAEAQDEETDEAELKDAERDEPAEN